MNATANVTAVVIKIKNCSFEFDMILHNIIHMLNPTSIFATDGSNKLAKSVPIRLHIILYVDVSTKPYRNPIKKLKIAQNTTKRNAFLLTHLVLSKLSTLLSTDTILEPLLTVNAKSAAPKMQYTNVMNYSPSLLIGKYILCQNMVIKSRYNFHHFDFIRNCFIFNNSLPGIKPTINGFKTKK